MTNQVILKKAALEIEKKLLAKTTKEELIKYLEEHHGDKKALKTVDVGNLVDNFGITYEDGEKPYVQGYNDLFEHWGLIIRERSEKEVRALLALYEAKAPAKLKAEVEEDYLLGSKTNNVAANMAQQNLSIEDMEKILAKLKAAQ